MRKVKTYRKTYPTLAPIEQREVKILVKHLRMRACTTRQAAAAITLLTMGRVGWKFAPVGAFCRWIKCDARDLPRNLRFAGEVGASGVIKGGRVWAGSKYRAVAPYHRVHLPVKVGNKKRLIRELEDSACY